MPTLLQCRTQHSRKRDAGRLLQGQEPNSCSSSREPTSWLRKQDAGRMQPAEGQELTIICNQQSKPQLQQGGVGRGQAKRNGPCRPCRRRRRRRWPRRWPGSPPYSRPESPCTPCHNTWAGPPETRRRCRPGRRRTPQWETPPPHIVPLMPPGQAHSPDSHPGSRQTKSLWCAPPARGSLFRLVASLPFCETHTGWKRVVPPFIHPVPPSWVRVRPPFESE